MTAWDEEQLHIDKVTKDLITQVKQIKKQKKEIAQKQQRALQNKKIPIKDGNEQAFYESAVEWKQFEDELQMNEQLWEQWAKKEKLYEKMVGNPYFGKLYVQLEGESLEIYLGLANFGPDENPEIYDWRAPIGDLFYQDELGEMSYALEDGAKQTAYLENKRQFVIEKGQLNVMADTKETIVDQILLQALEEKSQAHMKEVVTTIQKDQNTMIRDPHRHVLIEGVAGSGKTVVLMQRIAYQMYRQRKYIKVNERLMFSPNPIFSDYISQVLPSLGEIDIQRLEWDQWIWQLVPYQKEETKEEFLAFEEDLLSMKGLQLLKEYIATLPKRGLQFRNISFGLPKEMKPKLLFSKKKWQELYQALPEEGSPAQKMDVLRQKGEHALEKVQQRYVKSQEFAELFELYAPELLDQLQQQVAPEQLEEVVTEQLLDAIFYTAKRAIQQLKFVHLPKQCLDFYQWILTKEEYTFAKGYAEYFIANIKNHQLTAVQAKFFLFFQQWLTPKTLRQNYESIFVDEVQDYTGLDFCLLKLLFPHAEWTLCGDYHQLLAERTSVLPLLDEIFQTEFVRHQLLTNYRSTQEITRFSNAIMELELEQSISIRQGEVPTFIHNFSELKNKKEERIAFIAPTKELAKAFYEEYKRELPLQWISHQKTLPETGYFVLEVALAKGLEFDEVVMVKTEAEQNKNILYTMATRAMHHLWIYAPKEEVPIWLKNISHTLYQKKD